MRISKRDLFSALGYEPHPGQVAVHRSKAPRRVLACGSRFGKSLCASMEAVAALLEPRDASVGWIVAPSLNLTDHIFLRVALTLQTHFKHRVREFSARERKLVVVNLAGGSSELHGMSADAPTSLLGAALDWLVIDEAAAIKDAVWTQHLSQRLLDRRGWSLVISTPRDKRGWFWTEFRRGQKRRDAAYESWSLPTWTNPHVDRDLIEAERSRLSPDEFASTYGGEFTGLDTTPCDRCGSPRALAVGTVLVGDDDQPRTCGECGDYIDAQGRTLYSRSSNGVRCVTVLKLEGRRDGSVAKPMRIEGMGREARGRMLTGAAGERAV